MEGLRRAVAILAGLAAVLLIPPAATAQSIAHVHASRVSVRTEPSSVAAIADFLTINTIVDILDRGSEWCRIGSSSTASLSGFIACRSLGDVPVTLEFLDAQFRLSPYHADPQLDLFRRRFWVAPSLQWLETIGDEMAETMLSPEHYAREESEGKALRPPDPEFNAMKARLRAATVPSSAAHHPEATHPRFYRDEIKKVLKEKPLPPVRPSFFRRDEPLFVIALRPLTLPEQGELAIPLADALSAVNKTPFRARWFNSARYAHIGPIGAWDISSVGVDFDSPVTLHAITARGEQTGLSISSIAVPIGIQLCMYDVMSYNAKQLNARWNTAIVGWVGKTATVPASVTTATMSETTQGRVTRQEIDLNGDTIVDFLVFTGAERTARDGDLYWKTVFANVDGLWMLVADAESKECT